MNDSLSSIDELVPFLRGLVDQNHTEVTLEELSLKIAQSGLRDKLARNHHITLVEIYECLGLRPQD